MCKANNCPREARHKGYCHGHYRSYLRWPDPDRCPTCEYVLSSSSKLCFKCKEHICLVPWCVSVVGSNGFCTQHSKPIKNYGISVDENIQWWTVRTKCAVRVCPNESEHIDHSHKADHVRGGLCRSCNHTLGNLENRAMSTEELYELVRDMVGYLEQDELNPGNMWTEQMNGGG